MYFGLYVNSSPFQFCNEFSIAGILIVVIILLVKKRTQPDEERLIKDQKGANNEIENVYDDKRNYKYDFSKAAKEFTVRHMKENDIDEEFAEGAVMNPMYAPEGDVFENPAYLVSYRKMS